MSDAPGLPDADVSKSLMAAVAEYPLPQGVPDADVNQADLALGMNVTTNTVGKWVSRSVLASEWADDDGIPVIEQGSMGRAYVIRLSHAWAWRQRSEDRREKKAAAARHAAELLQARALGLDIEQPEATIDPVTRRKLAEADIMWQRASALRRKLVELDEMTEMLEDVCVTIRNGIEAMPDRLERELGLKPEEVDMVERIGTDILAEMADRIAAAQLEERDITDVETDAQLTF